MFKLKSLSRLLILNQPDSSDDSFAIAPHGKSSARRFSNWVGLRRPSASAKMTFQMAFSIATRGAGFWFPRRALMASISCRLYDFLWSWLGMRRYRGDINSESCNGARRYGRPSLDPDNFCAMLVVRKYRLRRSSCSWSESERCLTLDALWRNLDFACTLQYRMKHTPSYHWFKSFWNVWVWIHTEREFFHARDMHRSD